MRVILYFNKIRNSFNYQKYNKLYTILIYLSYRIQRYPPKESDIFTRKINLDKQCFSLNRYINVTMFSICLILNMIYLSHKTKKSFNLILYILREIRLTLPMHKYITYLVINKWFYEILLLVIKMVNYVCFKLRFIYFSFLKIYIL